MFFLLSVRSVFVYLSYLGGTVQAAGIAAVAAGMVFCRWRTLWSLYLFAALIPLVSGVQALGYMKFAPVLSFGFSIIYTGWFLKRIFQKETVHKFASRRKDLVFVDFLAGIVCLSIVMGICRFPLAFSFHRLQYASTAGQVDPFWFMEAGYIILQGLFFYRVFDFETTDKKSVSFFVPCLYCHALIVVAFAFVQLVFNIPDQGRTGSVFSPFQNVHAFGGYVLVLFFFFLNLGLKIKKGKAVHWILVMALFTCLLVSGSTTSLIMLFGFGSLFFLTNFGMQRIIFIVVGVVMIIILGINLNPSFLPKGKAHSAYERYITRLNYPTALKALGGRFSSWDQALGMIREYPLTGTGVGSFYQVSRYYHFSQKAHPHRLENAHNYYLQFGAELGLPALAVFLSLLLVLFRSAIPFLTLPPQDPSQVQQAQASSGVLYLNGLIFGVSAFLSAMLTDHHLLLSTHQFLFWFACFGISSAVKFNAAGNNAVKSNFMQESKWVSALLLILFVVVGSAHAYNYFTGKTPHGRYEYGYYKYQRVNGERMRWTMKQSCTKITAKSDYLGFSLYTEPKHFESGAVHVDIFMDDVLIGSVLFDKKRVVHKYYHMPGVKGRMIRFKTRADSSYNPYKLGLTDDIRQCREQSVAVTDVQFFHWGQPGDFQYIKYIQNMGK